MIRELSPLLTNLSVEELQSQGERAGC
jgi:hypothetical protein